MVTALSKEQLSIWTMKCQGMTYDNIMEHIFLKNFDGTEKRKVSCHRTIQNTLRQKCKKRDPFLCPAK